MVSALLSLIVLGAIYYFLYSGYIKYVSPNLPESTWGWVKNPTPVQFVLALVVLTLLYRKVS